jgi:hypothetical protein
MFKRFLPILLFTFVFLSVQQGDARVVEQIGAVTRVQGAASGVLNGTKRALKNGSPIYQNEMLSTGASSRLEVKFTDDGVIPLGEKAKLTIDTLVFNPAQKNGRQSIKILSGAFRFASGNIAKFKPENVTFVTPVATIGIRGTEFIGGKFFAEMPPGQTHYGVLSVDGVITITTRQGSVVLNQPGQGTFIPNDGGKAPTTPRLWRAKAMTEAFRAVAFK